MLLWLDYESRSEADLEVVGTYKYAQDPSTEVLMLAYAYGEEEVKIWCPHEGPMPADLREGLEDPFQMIAAWYAPFERLITKFVLKMEIAIDRWIDPSIICRYLSMPGKLEKVGDILHMGELKKDEAGKKLIQMFCKPLTPGGELTLFGIEPAFFRNPSSNPREWEQFKDYCLQDVRSERAIYNKVKDFDLPDFEWENYYLDQIINDRGIATDSVLLQGASLVVEKEKAALTKELKELTGVSNPNSVKQFLPWVQKHGYIFDSLEKKWVKRVLDGEGNLDAEGKKGLELRGQLSKSSTAKFEAFRNAVNQDGRVRHLFSFMGAARTGRWSGGAGIQPHNLIKPSKALENHMDRALELLKAADYETIKKEFEYPLDVAAAAIRPILHAAPGHTFYIADLNAIESRVAGWVAGDETMMNIFKPTEKYPKGLDPYLAFAVQLDGHRTYEEMYHEWKVEKNKKYRNEAKAPVLGCIYGLSAGAIDKDAGGNLIKTGLLGYAAAMGIELDQELATKAVEVFRRTYSDIVNFWYDLHRAFSNVVENDAVVELGQLRLDKKGNVLRVWLPSGRALHYMNPTSVWEDATSKKGNSYRKNVLGYDGLNQETHSWGWVETRGAKIFENAVQGIARDVLANGIQLAEKKELPVCLHVHDEAGSEVPVDTSLTVKDLEDCLAATPWWAPGLILRAEGFSSDFYKKD